MRAERFEQYRWRERSRDPSPFATLRVRMTTSKPATGLRYVKSSVGGRRMGECDADAVDAAVGGGEDFEAEAVFFDDFAAKGDVAGDLRDEAAKGGGFVVLGQAEGGGLIGISLGDGCKEVFAGVGIFEVGV